MKIYVVVWSKYGMFQLEKAFQTTEGAFEHINELRDRLPEYYNDYRIEEIELDCEMK